MGIDSGKFRASKVKKSKNNAERPLDSAFRGSIYSLGSQAEGPTRTNGRDTSKNGRSFRKKATGPLSLFLRPLDCLYLY